MFQVAQLIAVAFWPFPPLSTPKTPSTVILDAVGRENDALQSFGRENIQGET
jgi:hypothetical protein